MAIDSSYNVERDLEICLMFKTIECMNIRKGVSHDESKRIAYEAIELRFAINKTRIRHIINKNICKDYKRIIPRVIQDNCMLIEILKEINDDYKS